MPSHSGSDNVRERRIAKVPRSGKPSAEENALQEKVSGLLSESTKVYGGRDASVILAEADELLEQVQEASLTPSGKAEMIESLAKLHKDLAFENKMEKNLGRYVQAAFFFMTIVPALLSAFEKFYEYAVRPEMVVEPAALSNMHAVITGGCGALGMELAIMLANSGAGVVVACHGPKNRELGVIEARFAKLNLLHGSTRSDDSDPDQGWIKVWPIQLESFGSVRAFASRVARELGTIDILVHNAATKQGCSRTVDGHEYATQVNYLSPFLLNHLLLPAFREGTARVVHVTCDAGLQKPDWLPWPLCRTQPELLPRLDFEVLKRFKGNVSSQCSPLVEYAKTKLALLAHSHELNRHLTGYENRGVAHVVNPGAMDNEFGRGESAPVGKASARTSMMQYLPPVLVANFVYTHTLGKVVSGIGRIMLRPTEVGAKAVFHVATSPALGFSKEEEGGGLFSDTVGKFTDCGKELADCGRVPLHKQPMAAQDLEQVNRLWIETERALGEKVLRSLPELPHERYDRDDRDEDESEDDR